MRVRWLNLERMNLVLIDVLDGNVAFKRKLNAPLHSLSANRRDRWLQILRFHAVRLIRAGRKWPKKNSESYRNGIEDKKSVMLNNETVQS